MNVDEHRTLVSLCLVALMLMWVPISVGEHTEETHRPTPTCNADRCLLYTSPSPRDDR